MILHKPVIKKNNIKKKMNPFSETNKVRMTKCFVQYSEISLQHNDGQFKRKIQQMLPMKRNLSNSEKGFLQFSVFAHAFSESLNKKLNLEVTEKNK